MKITQIVRESKSVPSFKILNEGALDVRVKKFALDYLNLCEQICNLYDKMCPNDDWM